jgi:hypothetical protein
MKPTIATNRPRLLGAEVGVILTRGGRRTLPPELQ